MHKPSPESGYIPDEIKKKKKDPSLELDHDINMVSGPDGSLRVVKNRKDRAAAAQEIHEEEKDLN